MQFFLMVLVTNDRNYIENPSLPSFNLIAVQPPFNFDNVAYCHEVNIAYPSVFRTVSSLTDEPLDLGRRRSTLQDYPFDSWVSDAIRGTILITLRHLGTLLHFTYPLRTQGQMQVSQ
jgi:hypothetical protein